MSIANELWQAVDILRGEVKSSEYGKYILPLVILRRIEQVSDVETLHSITTGAELARHIATLSGTVRNILSCFDFDKTINKTHDTIVQQLALAFSCIDVHPDRVNSGDMGMIFEDMIHRFASDETAGEFYTPTDIVKLITELVIPLDISSEVAIYDPTCGTGGILGAAEEVIRTRRPGADVTLYGQELNPESFAICRADMLLRGRDPENIRLGNTLSEDKLAGRTFDFILSNPPYGVDWKKIDKLVRAEHCQGFAGRYPAGLPRVSDGSLLFVQHVISKLAPGGRAGIVLNGSPLFTGGAGSGESQIRRHILENDLLDCIIGLPKDMFYNTGITTYIWILTNEKRVERKGLVTLIDASDLFEKMRKSQGNKCNQLTDAQIAEIVKLYRDNQPGEKVKIFPYTAFGFRRITVKRPDENGKPDKNKRDNENVPLGENIDAYFAREVTPHVPDAWIDRKKRDPVDGEVGIVGYEIPFNRHFYVYVPPRPLEEIDAELASVSREIAAMLAEMQAY
ncbi:N-6 DNA methylase [Escherichia coli]|nr:N-6 DNA methylase [Escherichia coli]HAW2057546.1 SAM-dependent DNA methyltransferase [Escherichia coli]